MATTAVSVLEQRLSESINDYLQVAVTTAIGAGVTIISTNLKAFDGGRDDYFNDWWVYITDKANIAIQRQVSDYATATGTLTVLGANFTSDGANLATIRLHRYNRDLYVNAMNEATRELYPALFQYYDFAELVTGNILPNSHFRDWAASTVPDKYSLSNATAAANTTVGNYRGGGKSAKVTASVANGYLFITSNDYPALLDLMGQTVDFYSWAKPENANDAFIVIYTLKADGTAQTLTSTTTCPAGQYTLLSLKNQALNDDLVLLEARFKVGTLNKYAYFDNARLIGHSITRYLLPTDLVEGQLQDVYIQARSLASYPCDDLAPQFYTKINDVTIENDGTNSFLRIPAYTDQYLIRLRGKKPLSTVSAYTDTIEISGPPLNLWLAYAKYKFWSVVEKPVASRDIGRYETETAKAYAEYQRLSRTIFLPSASRSLKLPSW